jgi:transporter family-2 protein
MHYKVVLLASLPLGLALLAGVLIPIQAASGSTLGRALGNPLWGAAVALFIGVIAILSAALMLRLPAPSVAGATHGPWWMWIGGVTGALYVVMSLALLPRIGAGTFIVCVVAGQITSALLLDHFGMLGLATKPITLGRVAGVVVIFVGILITQLNSTVVSTPRETATKLKPDMALPLDQR